MFHDCGEKVVTREEDKQRVQKTETEDSVDVIIRARRNTESNYVYRVRLNTEDVLRCLFTLPADTIADAVSRLKEAFPLEEILPELQKQLTLGALQTEEEEEEGQRTLFDAAQS